MQTSERTHYFRLHGHVGYSLLELLNVFASHFVISYMLLLFFERIKCFVITLFFIICYIFIYLYIYIIIYNHNVYVISIIWNVTLKIDMLMLFQFGITLKSKNEK